MDQGQSRLKKVTLMKLGDCENPLHPNHIPEGYIKQGVALTAKPVVGESYIVITDRGYWRTSQIQEVIDDTTFKTFNSIYKITYDTDAE